MIESIINQFHTITLDEMKSIKLMNRNDTKFVTSESMLCDLLQLAKDDYRVQTTDGQRVAPYATLYFDTPDCEMYMAHQNGHLNRQKVRIRSYAASDLHFLEVKNKDNHRRTHKKRVAIDAADHRQWHRMITANQGPVQQFLAGHLRYDNITLVPTLSNTFRRITLVNNARTERLTIDRTLQLHNHLTGRHLLMSGLVIIELKRDGLQPSPILDTLLRLRIKPHGFSKYCMGLAFTHPDLKHNLFKERMRSIERIAGSSHHTPLLTHA